MFNRHGLTRRIPPEIKLAVRQACGFGCVVCGASIIEYEHVAPEFHDAKTHDVSGIALLCASCHDKVTRKFWSKDKIAEARRLPKCKTTGFSWGEFDVGQNHPIIRFGGVTLRNCMIPVEVKNTPVIQIEKPEVPGSPFLLSATFADASGVPIFEIKQNEWTAKADVWDTECIGGRILISDKIKSQQLALKTLPPNGISVELMDMQVRGYRIMGNADTLRIRVPGGLSIDLTNGVFDGGRVGVCLS